MADKFLTDLETAEAVSGTDYFPLSQGSNIAKKAPVSALKEALFSTGSFVRNLLNAANAVELRLLMGLNRVDNTTDEEKPVSTAVQNVLNGKANNGHVHMLADVNGLQAALDAKEPRLPTRSGADSGKSLTVQSSGDLAWMMTSGGGGGGDMFLADNLAGLHDTEAARGNLGVTWPNLLEKPTVFAPDAHTHAIADTSGLQAALNAKASLSGADFTGAVSVGGTVRSSVYGSTGQFAAVSGSTFASLYNDGTYAYILKSATSNSAFDTHRPLSINLATGQVVINSTGVGGTVVGGPLSVTGAVTVGGKAAWADGYIPTNAWCKSTDGKNRFQFAANDATYFGTGNGYIFNQPNGSPGLVVDIYGGLHVDTGELWIGGNKWLRFGDTNGIFWQTYGGGWHMSDTTYMRCYGDRTIVTGGAVQCSQWIVTSDARLKSNIKPLQNAAAVIASTNVYSYIKGDKMQWGVLAQEALANPLTAMLVSEGGQLLPDGKTKALTVDAMGYVYALIDTVKELLQRVEDLEGARSAE